MEMGPVRVGAAVGRTNVSAVVLAGLMVSLAGCQGHPAPTSALSPAVPAQITLPVGDGGVVVGISACWTVALPEPKKDRRFLAGTGIFLRGTVSDLPLSGGGYVKDCRTLIGEDELTSHVLAVRIDSESAST
jgi:hypothetical protein